nr:Scr1 family TA system antitoxin-like transcriptional regulator [Lentzea flaviverrucosa]
MRVPMGGRVGMAQQVHHLTQFAERPNVTINVIPAEVVAHPGLTGAFVIMSFDDAPTVAHIEARTARIFTDEPRAVAFLQQTAGKLLALSLNPVESIRLMTSIVEDLSRA